MKFDHVKILLKVAVFIGMTTIVGAIAWVSPEDMVASILLGIAAINILYVIMCASSWSVDMLIENVKGESTDA